MRGTRQVAAKDGEVLHVAIGPNGEYRHGTSTVDAAKLNQSGAVATE
jgi:hypothetical protein